MSCQVVAGEGCWGLGSDFLYTPQHSQVGVIAASEFHPPLSVVSFFFSGNIFFCVKESPSPGLVCTYDSVHSRTGHVPFLSAFCKTAPIISVPRKSQGLLMPPGSSFVLPVISSPPNRIILKPNSPITALLLTMLRLPTVLAMNSRILNRTNSPPVWDPDSLGQNPACHQHSIHTWGDQW